MTIKERFVVVRQVDFGKGFQSMTFYETAQAAGDALVRYRGGASCRDGNFDLDDLYEERTREGIKAGDGCV